MSLEHDYHAVRTGAVLGALAPSRHIAVGGADRASYLQGLLTNDILALTPGSSCYAAWLTPQGRMLTDLHVLESGDMILLDLPAAEAEPTLQRLDQFLFSEDVRLELLDGRLGAVWVHGPAAGGVLDATLRDLGRAETWPCYHVGRATFGDSHVIAARVDQLGVPGYCVYAQPDTCAALTAALEAAGAAPAGADALDACRIEAGYPLFGVDMTYETIPLEAGIEERAISFTKGCYVGQEVIIRVLHRGHGRVARRLVALRVDGQVPASGATLRAGERDIGFVTSAARSPALGPIALGYVHRDFVAPGTSIDVLDDSTRYPAIVTERPMPVEHPSSPFPADAPAG